MTVYVEYAFLDNFTMDFLLLFCAAATLKMRFRWWRVALGSVVGAAFALATPLVGGVWTYLLKAACLFSMCFVAVGWGRKLFWHILLTLAYTFVTGGAITGIFNLLNVDFVTDDGLYYNMPVPLFVYIIGVFATVLLCYLCVAQIKRNKQLSEHLKKVKITLDKTYSVMGFCDSGNSVSCNGLPVCFVTRKFGGVQKYFADKLLKRQTEQLEVSTLTGSSKLIAVPALVEVDGVTYNIYLALPEYKCRTQYELLLSGEFCDDVAA